LQYSEHFQGHQNKIARLEHFCVVFRVLQVAPAGSKEAPAGGKVLNVSLQLLYRPLELLYHPLELGAGGKELLYRPPEPRKQACKEEARTSNM
jgi:hypothetical protein